MKNKLYTFFLILSIVSCKTSYIAKVISSQTNEEVNGKVVKIIERRYLDNTNSKSLTNERHLIFNRNKQVTNIIEYRVYKNIETGINELEMVREFQYLYNWKKIIKIIEISNFRTTEVTTATEDDNSNISEKAIISTIEYSYLDKNTASYQAYHYNEYDHTGTISTTAEYEIKEIIKYPNESLKPVTYKKIFNKELKMIKYEREYYYNNELKTDEKTYTYVDNNLFSIIATNYKINYNYEFDSIGNWTKRIGRIDDEIVDIISREIVYK